MNKPRFNRSQHVHDLAERIRYINAMYPAGAGLSEREKQEAEALQAEFRFWELHNHYLQRKAAANRKETTYNRKIKGYYCL